MSVASHTALGLRRRGRCLASGVARTGEAIRFLTEKLGMDRATALAYLSAAADAEVSQVVDKTKGIHFLIRKSDFKNVT